MRQPESAPRRRLWPVFVPIGLVVVLALVWTGFWFLAARAAETTIAGWREREAKVGRIYTCDKQTVGGFPFRIEVRCVDPSIELRRNEPPVALKASDLAGGLAGLSADAADQRIRRPDDDCRAGPAAELHRQLDARAIERARHAGGARAGVDRGRSPDGGSHGRRRAGNSAQGGSDRGAWADRGRLGHRRSGDRACVAAGVRDGAGVARVHEAADRCRRHRQALWPCRFRPKPWPVRFKEIQARGGRIEITQARVQQGEAICGQLRHARLDDARRPRRPDPSDDRGPRKHREIARSRSRDFARQHGFRHRGARPADSRTGAGRAPERRAGHPGGATRDGKADHARRQARNHACRCGSTTARSCSGRSRSAACRRCFDPLGGTTSPPSCPRESVNLEPSLVVTAQAGDHSTGCPIELQTDAASPVTAYSLLASAGTKEHCRSAAPTATRSAPSNA